MISFWLLQGLVGWLITSVFMVGNSSIPLAEGGCGSSLPTLHVAGGILTNTAGSRCLVQCSLLALGVTAVSLS